MKVNLANLTSESNLPKRSPAFNLDDFEYILLQISAINQRRNALNVSANSSSHTASNLLSSSIQNTLSTSLGIAQVLCRGENSQKTKNRLVLNQCKHTAQRLAIICHDSSLTSCLVLVRICRKCGFLHASWIVFQLVFRERNRTNGEKLFVSS